MASAANVEEAGNVQYQSRHMNEIFRAGMSFSGYERDGLYLSLGNGRFREISGVSGIDSLADGRGSVFADFDNDGDLDVLTTTIQKTSRLLFRNNVGQDNAFLRVTLEGTASGRGALGAVVRIKTPLGIQTKLRAAGSGHVSSHDPRLLFGLGSVGAIEWMEVTWPSGRTQRFTGVRPGQSVKAVEGVDDLVPVAERRLHLVDPQGLEERAYASLEIQRGERLPAFPVTDLSGNAAGDLSASLRPGRRTLLNFWATWCAPCRAEMHELQRLWPGLQAAGVDLIGVSLDFDDAGRVRRFLEQNGIRYPVRVAAPGSLDALIRGDDLGVPFSLLVDGNGALEAAYSGWSRRTQDAIERLASEARDKAAPAR